MKKRYLNTLKLEEVLQKLKAGQYIFVDDEDDHYITMVDDVICERSKDGWKVNKEFFMNGNCYFEEEEPMQEASEKWKVLENFPDYKVSTLGRVFSMKTNKIMKPYKSRGYCVVDLGTRKIKRGSVYVHRLVAEAFIPNPNNKEEVNHKNSKRDDNRLENLEWVTPKENVRHSYEFGLAKYANRNRDKQRESCSKPIVCVETGIKYDSISDASRKLGLHKANIARCVKNKNKSVHNLHFLPLPKVTKEEIKEFMEKAE